MAASPHTDIERRALWHAAKRLMASGMTRSEATTLLYRDWRPPFDFSRICWAVEDGEAVAAIEASGKRVLQLDELRRDAMAGSDEAAKALRLLAPRKVRR